MHENEQAKPIIYEMFCFLYHFSVLSEALYEFLKQERHILHRACTSHIHLSTPVKITHTPLTLPSDVLSIQKILKFRTVSTKLGRINKTMRFAA